MVLFALFLIIDCNSVYAAIEFAKGEHDYLYICFLLNAIILMCSTAKYHLRRNELIFAIGILFYFAIYLLLKYKFLDNSYKLIINLGVPILLTLFCQQARKGRRNELFYYIEKIVLVLVMISLPIWIFGCVLNAIHPNVQVNIYWGRMKTVAGFWNIHFITGQSTSIAKGTISNSGIFAEGPMFALWLCISLAVELFLKPESKTWKVVLLTGTILTTLSTSGIFFLALCVLLKCYLAFRFKKKKWMIAILLFGIIIIPIAANVLQSIFSLKASTYSYVHRMADYINGFRLWKEHPILGSGYGNLNSIVLKSVSDVGYSNTVTAILGSGGLYIFIIYLMSFITPIVELRHDKQTKVFCFVICYAYLSVVLIFYLRYIMAVMIGYGLSFAIDRSNRVRTSSDLHLQSRLRQKHIAE